MRAICGVKMIENRSQELLSFLELKNTLNKLARASGVRWYGHVLRWDDTVIYKKKRRNIIEIGSLVLQCF